MLRFEPEKSEIFQIAKVSLFLDSFPVLFLRFFLVGIFPLLSILFFQKPLFGLFLLFLSFELFYQFKIKKLEPKKTLTNFSEGDNLADFTDFNFAKLFQKASGLPDKLFWNLTLEKENLLFMKRTGIEEKKLASVTLQALNFQLVAEKAIEIARKRNSKFIESCDFFQSYFLTEKNLQKLLFELDVSQDDLENIAFWVREEAKFFQKPFINLDLLATGPGIAQSWISGYTTETEKYTKDVTAELIAKRTSPILIGRDKELSTICEILSRDKKKNVILVGEPGVGKTTVVYSLASQSYLGKLAPALRYKRVLELSVGDLLTAVNLGELETRLQAILTEIEQASDVIFYIPQIENIAGAAVGKERVDLTGVLLPTLQGAKVQVIGATTPKAFTNYIETRPAFFEQFEKVEISEPQASDAVKIAEQAAVRIEEQQKVGFTYGAVVKAVELSDRYMQDRVLPGKAIDLLSQAAVRVAQAGREFVTEDVITQLVSEKKSIPLEVAKGAEQQKLLNLEQILHERVVNQNEAIEAISAALRRARAQVRVENKPIGTFLFLGPTGVGKTETAKALAASYFGSEENIIRIDCSEYQTVDSVSRLIGEIGQKGQLTEQVRNKPFSLILLDEVEKAHRNVWQLFLQVFDEGRLTDAAGQKIDFRETLIIATSNAGAEQIRQALLAKKDLGQFREELVDFLFKNNIFTPEFLNRFDDVILFKPLTTFEIEQIVKLQIGQLAANLGKQEISIEVSDKLVSCVAKEGFDEVFGARPIRRFIADKIESALAEKILSAEIGRGDVVFVDIGNTGEIIFQKKGTKFANS